MRRGNSQHTWGEEPKGKTTCQKADKTSNSRQNDDVVNELKKPTKSCWSQSQCQDYVVSLQSRSRELPGQIRLCLLLLSFEGEREWENGCFQWFEILLSVQSCRCQGPTLSSPNCRYSQSSDNETKDSHNNTKDRSTTICVSEQNQVNQQTKQNGRTLCH